VLGGGGLKRPRPRLGSSAIGQEDADEFSGLILFVFLVLQTFKLFNN
jgi:hypothetical protein